MKDKKDLAPFLAGSPEGKRNKLGSNYISGKVEGKPSSQAQRKKEEAECTLRGWCND